VFSKEFNYKSRTWYNRSRPQAIPLPKRVYSLKMLIKNERQKASGGIRMLEGKKAWLAIEKILVQDISD
jgi:hypothetical protein